MERYTESYVAELAAFAHAILHGEPLPVTGDDGRIPVVMGLAAQRSCAENRPVRISEIVG
jgi:myo-inositol 2-dehydrogenase/D-chiro-inositol 1-dehydrogenase